MDSYSVNDLGQAAWLVYINGLEIPVSRVDVNYGIWQMPTLTLQMVPHPILTRIGAEDRLQVAVFYLDTHWDPEDPQFCLLGEFEVVGWGYNNTPRGRYIALSCVSHLQIFEQLKFYYISSISDIAGSVGTPAASEAKLYYPASLFLEGLITPPPDQDAPSDTAGTVDPNNYIKRPIDLVLNLFRALRRPIDTEQDDPAVADTGKLPRAATSVPGKNFFSRWLDLTGFHKRWAALPIFEDSMGDENEGCFPIVKASQHTETLAVLRKHIGQSVGHSGSAWKLLKQVLSYMYMEIGVIPAPPAAITTRRTGLIKGGEFHEVDDAYSVKSIPTFFIKPQCIFSLPPACNVIFPSMVTSYSFRETYITQPTRLYLAEAYISDFLSQGQSGAMLNLTQKLMMTGYPDPVRKRMRDLWEADSLNVSNKHFLIFPEEFYKGPVATQLNAPPWMYMLEQQDKAYVKKLAPDEGEDVGAQEKTAEQIESERLESEEVSEPLGKLFNLYAEYEFYRARYAERNGGLSLSWNPYIVPGFPITIFDDLASGIDTMAYATTVSHSMSAEGAGPSLSTAVKFSFMRTMEEFTGLLGGITKPDDEVYDIAPVEIVPEVSNIFQKLTTAHELYERLFYATRIKGKLPRSAVFNWKDIVQITNSRGDVFDPDDPSDRWKLNPYLTLSPTENYKPLFENRDAAMQYAARPVCTLRQYIETWHGKAVKFLLEDNIVRGEYTSFYSPSSDPKGTKGAVFWGRIYDLDQGPGLDPGVSVSNVGPQPDYAAAEGGKWSVVGSSTGMPQTRDDWNTRLEEYRKIIRSEEGRIAPQK